MLAAVGSAVGLANIWRFPYVLGTNGGAAFLLVYLICLFLIGFPVFVAEVFMGSLAKRGPYGAFALFGRSAKWAKAGLLIVLTGFVISAFYSVVAGWILAYFFESLRFSIGHFHSKENCLNYFEALMQSPLKLIFFHGLFLSFSLFVLLGGVQKGIERASRWMMPLLFVLLFVLVLKGLSLPGASLALDFLFKPDWESLTGSSVLLALGQAFFTLSLGQGTMMTYGSYLEEKETIISTSLPVLFVDTLISIFSGIAVFTIVFSSGMEASAGPGLIFQTLPLVFSQMTGGAVLMLLFFLLVCIAALSSEISALEPMIAFLVDEMGFKRRKASIWTCLGSFLLGIPCALAFNLWEEISVWGMNVFECISFLTTSIFVPLGGLLSVVLLAYVWGMRRALNKLLERSKRSNIIVYLYLYICIKYLAPIFILCIFVHSLMNP